MFGFKGNSNAREKVNYYSYMNSNEWKNKSRKFRRKTGDRCQIFPWLKAESSHHATYENLGSEQWNIDCIVVSQSAHKLIHGWLAGFRRDVGVSKQNENPKNKYPNSLQKTIHWYARIVGVVLYLIKFI